jgi:hypothetical protein
LVWGAKTKKRWGLRKRERKQKERGLFQITVPRKLRHPPHLPLLHHHTSFSPGHPQSISTVLSPGAQSLIPSSPYSAPSFTPKTHHIVHYFPEILGLLLSLLPAALHNSAINPAFPNHKIHLSRLKRCASQKPPGEHQSSSTLSRKAATTILQPHKYSLVVPQARRCVVDAQEHY